MKTVFKWGVVAIMVYIVVFIIAKIFGGIRPVDMQWIVPGWYNFVRPWAVVPYAMSGIMVVNTLIIATQGIMAFVYGCLAGGVVSLISSRKDR